jgi:transient receptor potential cation channel subfamily C member 4
MNVNLQERSDLEWKFARSKLWMSYFDAEDILPPPFNIMPSPGLFRDLLKLGTVKRTQSFKVKNKLLLSPHYIIYDMGKLQKKTVDKTQTRHDTVMQLLVKRYVTIETQRREDEYGITEDDVMEIRQDISSLRYELVDILKNNGMKTPDVDKGDACKYFFFQIFTFRFEHLSYYDL